MDKYRANNNSHNLHYLRGTTEWPGRQNNHRRTLRTRFHGFTLGHANNVTLTINAKENTFNMRRSHIGNFLLTFCYLQSAIIYNSSFMFNKHLEYFRKLFINAITWETNSRKSKLCGRLQMLARVVLTSQAEPG